MTQHIFKDAASNVIDAASNVQDLAARKYRRATAVVDGYVSDNPWKTIGIAAALGMLIGLLAAKR